MNKKFHFRKIYESKIFIVNIKFAIYIIVILVDIEINLYRH